MPNKPLTQLAHDIEAARSTAGDFAAGKRLRSLLHVATLETFGKPPGWSGILFHRSFGRVALEIHADHSVGVEVPALRQAVVFKVKNGRRWSLAR